MIEIKLNDDVIKVNANISLKEILAQQNLTQDYFAVAINRTFIPRSQHESTILNPNDHIEIVIPMQGG